tara:strand:- start:1099 stop:1620 length:522 start_codon:yes stop_codon:yes gene_type:complete
MKFKKFYYKKIKSTNDKALKHIIKGDEKGIILTDVQVKGKGQRGKNWISLKGNLFMSVFFEIKNKSNLKKITNLNCYLVRDCLQKLINFKISIKRPNDLLIKKQKICGILQETIFKKHKKFLVVGIGINIDKSPKIKNYQTNFINFFTKKNVTRLRIFKLLCNSYEKKINLLK